MEAFATGTWLTRSRVRAVALVLVVGTAAAVLVLLATRTGPYGTLDKWGRPLGTDFTLIWSAGTLALEGRAAGAYDWTTIGEAEKATHGTEDVALLGWHYPPIFFLLAAPLASLPYIVSLVLWQAVTLAGAASVAWRILPRWDTLLIALGFPAVLVCLAHGHNGFLTAALFGSGLLLLDSRPFVAGLLLGCLAYKPQFGIILPLALVAGWYWRAIAGATIAVIVLVVAALAFFGAETWAAFFSSIESTRRIAVEDGATGWYKIQSIFAWVRMLGGSLPLAYAAQGFVSFCVTAATVWLWFIQAPMRLRAACLLLASLLSTPYLLDYDLVLLGPAIALLASYGLEHGFRRWEATALAFAWVVPIAARALAFFCQIPSGFLAVSILFILAASRAMRESAGEASVSRIAASWRRSSRRALG